MGQRRQTHTFLIRRGFRRQRLIKGLFDGFAGWSRLHFVFFSSAEKSPPEPTRPGVVGEEDLHGEKGKRGKRDEWKKARVEERNE